MEYLDAKNFTCTKLIDIKTYFNKFVKDIENLNNINENQHSEHTECPSANSVLGVPVTDEQLNKLKSISSITNLHHEDEVSQTDDYQTLWKFSEFKSESYAGGHLKIQKVRQNWEKRKEMKHVFSFPAPRELDNVDEEDLVPRGGDQFVIVRLYKPFQYSTTLDGHHLRYTHEIAILGSQTLTDLRDQFKCVHDMGATVELEYPVDTLPFNSKDEYPSGFIFIENCFYNDMRHPKAFEYSKEIVEWATKKNIAEYTTANMEDMKIVDLKLRIGYPYLYQHHANCQHLVIFTEIRLLRPDELRNSSKYPYLYSVNNFNTLCCIMCKRKYAKFIITECDRLVAKLNILCKSCVLMYNYKDGKKIGSFKLDYKQDMYEVRCKLIKRSR